MADLAVGASLLLAGLSLMLAVVGWISAARLKSGRLAWVAIAFTGFAAEGTYLTQLAWDRRSDVAAGTAGEFPVLAIANLGIVIALYFSVLKR